MTIHDTEMPYPDEIGVVKFKDGTYDVYPELANVAPSVKYIRADKPAHAPSITDGEVAEAIVWVRNMMATVENTAPQDHAAVETLIRAADGCIDAEFSLSCAKKRIAELECNLVNERQRISFDADEIYRLKAQLSDQKELMDKEFAWATKVIMAADEMEKALNAVLKQLRQWHWSQIKSGVNIPQEIIDADTTLITYRAAKDGGK